MSENMLAQAAQLAGIGRTKDLQDLLAQSPEVLYERTNDGDSLLGLACRAATGDIAIPPDPGTPRQHAAVDLILAAGADPDVADDDGWTPLHTAAMAGHTDLAKRLLDAGASRQGHLYGASGGSPLALSLFYAQTDVGELLAQPAVPDNLRHAAALGHDIERFLNDGVLNNDATEGLDFYGPLIYFPRWQRSLSRQEVLDEALTWAARNSQIASIQKLVQLGADVNSNPYRGTALLWAIYADSIDTATWLLDNGADPNLRHAFGGEGHGVGATAIHLASQFNATECIELLLSHGADPNIVDEAYGGDALGWAEFSGAQDAVELLRNWKV